MKNIIAIEGPCNVGKTFLARTIIKFAIESRLSVFYVPDYHSFSISKGFAPVPKNSHLNSHATTQAASFFIRIESMKYELINSSINDFDIIILDRSYLSLLSHIRSIYNLGFIKLSQFEELENNILMHKKLVCFNHLILFKFDPIMLTDTAINNEYGIFGERRYNLEFGKSLIYYYKNDKQIYSIQNIEKREKYSSDFLEKIIRNEH